MRPLAKRVRDVLAAAVIGAAACVATAVEAREGAWHAPRFAMQHGGQAEARAARQAERAQQRAARANAVREMPVQRAPEIQAPPQMPDPGVERGRPGRLTPDERRALRQQINDAGRDVYRPNRP